MHLKEKGFVTVTILALISQVWSDFDGSRNRRATDEGEQPRIITTNGHLLFQTGENHNITFKTGTSGRVLIGEQDLTDTIDTVRGNKAIIESLQTQLNNALQELLESQNSIATLTTKVANLESQGTGPDIGDEVMAQVTTLQSDVNSLKASLQVNECNSNPCQNGGTCTNLFNGYQCQCANGWTGVTCSRDVNECASIAGTPAACQNGGTCVNEDGSYRCQCTSDWYGPKCTIQYDDCSTASHDQLCGHGYCVNEARVDGTPKYSCICFDGWKTDSSSNNPACSIDINECDNSPCFEDVTCVNVPGTFFCGNCPTGFTGNGFQCSDINECSINNGGCSLSPVVACINTRGSRECGACPTGYMGDGVTCTYVGVCNINNGGCNSMATCTENSGVISGRTCTCRDGYTGNGEGLNGCARSPQACTNNPCVYGRCVPDGPSYSCVCTLGFTGRNCETDVDECASSPCQNGGTCVDGTNGYRCNCASGYTGTRCEDSTLSCGGSYMSELGSFSFPGDGQSYPHSASCTWTITTSIDEVLVLQFSRLKIEVHESCNFDYVRIFDGPSSSSFPLSDQICGNTVPDPVTSTHNVVTVQFVSDASVNGEGFTLQWSSVDPVCGGTLDDSNHGEISSPGYPGNYPVLRDCTWSITVEAGQYIMFAFASIALEESSDCSKDYLEVYDGLTDQATLLGQYCSSVSPTPLQTSGPYAFVRFHSDSSTTAQGFHITYVSAPIDPGCGGALTDSSGVIISPNYPNDYNHNTECIWTIQLPEGESIRFEITDLQVETHGSCLFDYVEVRDGFDETAPFVGRYCDSSSLPPPFISSSNELNIKFHSDASIAFGGFRAIYSVDCGGVFTEDNGELVSPYFPNSYPHDNTCEYVVTAGSGQGVQVSFMTLAIEYHSDCQFDYLEAHDGATEDAPLIDRFCGAILPDSFITTQSSLYMKFVTDGSVTNYGFRLAYTFVDVQPPTGGCGGYFSSPTGIISSPTHPEQYPHNIHCVYVVEVDPGNVVRLTFTSFVVEEHSSCSFDYVEVYDNSTTSGNPLLGRYCGSVLPPVITSSGNILTVVFDTDGSVSYEGFTISYESLDSSSVCGYTLTATAGVVESPGYPSNYFNNANCEWTITVPSGQQISVNVTNLDIESTSGCTADFLEFRNGGYSTSPLITTLCGTNLPPQLFVSHSNRMYLRFRSNQAVTSSGFSLSYDGTATGCGGTLTSPTGSFVSPNYPSAYNHNAQCNWIITVNQGSQITLTFSDFDVESHYSCAYDSVKIYDGPDTYSPLLGNFCGSDIPPTVTSTGHQMYIRYRTDYSVARSGFLASYTAGCEEVRLTQRSGYIESPNYPNAYPHNRDCSWVLEAPLGNHVNITFLHINLEYHSTCNFDYIKLYDAETATGNPLATFCGTEADGTSFVSTGNQLRLEFHSDVSIALAGFRAYYAIDICGDELTENSGELMSPNFPDPYDHSSTCHWTITVENDHSITLTIQTIDVERSTSCEYDALRIYSGSDDSGMLLAELCESTDQPQSVSTTGNLMFIQFTTDSSVNGGGFSASYVSNEGDCSNSTISAKNVTNVTKNQTNVCVPGCGGHYSLSTGTLHSPNYPSAYPHNTECNWVITVEEGARVELTFTAFRLESANGCVYDFVKIYDGDSSIFPVLQTLCGYIESPPTVISTSNTMFVRMYSDSSVAYPGFQANYITGCGGNRDATAGGFISSPNYPQPYSVDHNCSWIIESSDPADRITLTFVAMDLEVAPSGCYDYVDVILGGSPSSPADARICGTSLPTPVTSYGSSLMVNFVSDGSNHGSGFKIFYSTTGAACGGDLSGSSGRFASPGYPDSYSTSMECVWTISVTPGSRLQISFIMFSIEASTNCSTDFLELREDDETGAVLGRFCGAETPSTLTLTSSVWIRFHSDDSGTAQGFVAAFQEILGGEFTGSSGTIVSPNFPSFYSNDLNVNWLIMVESNYFIRIDVTNINIEGGAGSECPFDTLKLYDGASDQNGVLAVICGTPGDQVIYTTGNSVFVEFVTDGSITESGFRLQWQQTETLVTAEPPESTTGVVDTGCNRALTASDVSQSFASPGYPDNYANNLDCRYVITAQPTSTIMLNFTNFELEFSSSCVFDYVRVFDGATEGDAILGTFCGSTTEVVYSTGRSMMVLFHSDSSETYLGFSATFREHCGGTYRMQEGQITSPGYPSNYANNLNCTYLIETSPGFIIVFHSVDIDIEESPSCNKDAIIVYNGRDETAPPLGGGIYCGSGSTTGYIRSSSNAIMARFITDDSGTGEGFSASYITFSDSCGGTHSLSDSVPTGQISSPNYPSNYDQNADCHWLINSLAGTVIKATFEEDFFIESHPSCVYDYVQVLDGSLSTSDVLGTFCGSTAPPPVISTSNAMRIRFRTDASVTHVGFSLTYSIAQCGGSVSGMSGTVSSPGFPANYSNDLSCEWHLQGPIGHYLTLFISFTIQSSDNCSSDFLAVYDGTNSSSPLLGKFCGSSPVSTIDTSSNYAYVKFVSDSSVSEAGFQISFEASEHVCGGDLVTPTGTLQSPGYPYPYDHRRICEWRITVQEGHLVNLYFNDLDVEQAQQCIFDSVNIYNGLEDDAPLITTVCGVVSPDKISSSGRTMKVVFRTDGSVNGRGFQARYDSLDSSVCGGALQTTPPSTGVISSPGYQLTNYSADLSCDWTLSNTQVLNSSFLLTFSDDWGLEGGSGCIHDYVEVRQGVDVNGPLIGKYCGSVAPQPISVPWNSLFIRFKTDASVADRGFQMTYRGTDCGGIVTGTSGVITSPSFPESYRGQDHCAWLIQAPAGSIISMTFTNFSVEAGSNCQYDSVIIKSGGSWDSPSFSGEFGWCDSNLPPEGNVVTSSNQAMVIFTTDVSDAGTGFRLEWSTETTGCGGLFHANSGSIQSRNFSTGYPPNENCVWMLLVESGYQVTLTFADDYEVLSGDSITIYDGSNTGAPVIQTFDTSRPSQPIRSSFNAITVRFRTDGTLGGRGFRASWTTGCGGTITALSGRITSQGYPYRNYDDDVHCEYIIEGQSSSSLLITFDDLFSLEVGSDCAYDYLSFYDGRDNSGTLLGKFCDSGSPDQIENSGPVFVVFHTDGNINNRGFGFSFEPGCGGTFTQDSGVVGTPLHLDTYRHSQNCTFLIQVNERKSVQLRFTNFSLEQGYSCEFDYVVAYDGSDTNSPPLTSPLCGSSLPNQLTSTGNTMLLNFVTDSSVAREGFQAAYQAVYGPAVGCGGTKTEATGTIQSVDLDLDGDYEPNLDCTWNIGLSNTTKVIRLEFQGSFGIQQSGSNCEADYLEIRDGFGIYAPLVGRYCGGNAPPAIQLSGTQAYLRFVSNSDTEGAGFTLNYDLVNRTCGGLLEATEAVQVVTSPNYPQSYSHNMRCTWTVSAAGVHDKVRFITSDIDIESHDACLYDYVQFSDFPRTGDAQDVHYCGQDIPAPFNSAGRSAQIYFSTDLNSAGRGFSINYTIADCNQTLSSSFGHLTSPGYPTRYNNDHNCTTLLSSPSGTFLVLYFDDFQLESGVEDCVFDYLRVLDGPSSNSSEVLLACHDVTPDPVFASGNSLYLEFVSDVSLFFRGYSITYTSSSISSGCGGSLSGISGSFTSPNFPSTYPANLTCDWSIEVPARRQPVSLEFTVFSVEGVAGVCQQDYVEVYSGTTATHTLIGRYCGTNIPAKITSTASIRNFFVRFVTNSNNAGDEDFTGFRAVYTS